VARRQLKFIGNKEIISYISIRQSKIIALSNRREAYINHCQNRDPSVLRETIDNIKKELDNKFNAFVQNENVGLIPTCYFQLFFWHRYFKKMTIDMQDLKYVGFNIVIGNQLYRSAQLDRTQAIIKHGYSSYVDI
jgi:hypothetical protein